MGRAGVPVLPAPDPEELAMVKQYAKLAMEAIGDGSLLHDPARAAVAAAAREEVRNLANLTLAEGQLKAKPMDEVWLGRKTTYRHALCKALRDQGRLYEALAYADTPSDQESLSRGFLALERDDDDFECAEGCQDPVAVLDNQPRQFTRWDRVKQDIPRIVDGNFQWVTLWRCNTCGDYNASQLAPPSRAAFEMARSKAGPETRDGDILPVVTKDANT